MTPPFVRREGVLHAEAVDLRQIARVHGTPCYVYSRQAFTDHFEAYRHAFADQHALVCYAVKANSNLAVLNVLARLGAGFDTVSIGEIERAIEAGGEASKIVFSGVAKREDEMARALTLGIKCFNVESVPELDRLNAVAARLGQRAPVSLRVNPDIDAKTHPYISTGLKDNKFGIAIDDAEAAYAHAQALPHLDVIGIDCHIGSQLTSLTPFLDALDRLIMLIGTLAAQGTTLHHIDLGGGIGVDYQGEVPPSLSEYAAEVRRRLEAHDCTRSLSIILEPGRSIAANAGLLLTRVEFLKVNDTKHFAIIDAGMNDLIRPSLYQAWQRIERIDNNNDNDNGTARVQAVFDVVGPVCESSDFLGKDRALSLAAGDVLAVFSAGAYGFTMASNYNARPRPAELMVDGNACHVVRERETVASLWQGEHCLPL